jgi:hypothetical protein
MRGRIIFSNDSEGHKHHRKSTSRLPTAAAVVAALALRLLTLARDSDLDAALKSDLYDPLAGKPCLRPPPCPALNSNAFT